MNEYQPLQWLWEVRDTEFDNPLERLLAYQMLAHADVDGMCYPSVDRLSLVLGVGRTQTQTLRRQLRDRGLLELVKKGHRGHASTYKLTLKALSPPPNKALSLTEHQEVHEEIQVRQEEPAALAASGVDDFDLEGLIDDYQEAGSLPASSNGGSQTQTLTAQALEGKAVLPKQTIKCDGCGAVGVCAKSCPTQPERTRA